MKVLTTNDAGSSLLQTVGQGYPVVPQDLGALGTGSISFVWRPGGTAGGNVYPSWAAVVAAMAAVQGSKILFVDDSIAAAQVPAGTWTLDAVRITCSLSHSAVITFAAGAKWVAPNGLYIDNVLLTGALTTPVVDVGAGQVQALLFTFANLQTTGAPFAQTSGGGFLFVLADGTGLDTGTLGTTAAGDTCNVLGFNNYFFGANVIQGTLGTRAVSGDATGFFGSPQTAATVTLLDRSFQVSYAPSSPSSADYWVTVPTTVATGLNQLSGAAAVECEIQNATVAQAVATATPVTLQFPTIGRSAPAGFGVINQIVIPANGVYELFVSAGFGPGALPAGATFVSVNILLGGVGPLYEFNRAVVNVNDRNTVSGAYRGFFNKGQILTAQILWSGAAGSANTDISAGHLPRFTAALVR